VPNASRLAILWNGEIPSHGFLIQEAERAARTMGIAMFPLEARNEEQLAKAFAEIVQKRIDALVVLPMGWVGRRSIDLAARNRVPTMYGVTEYPEAGALMAYAADMRDNWRRAATYVDKILKGARPADLPVEQPTKFEFVVNLKTARALGLKLPTSVLVRADRVIE
jgi:putative ABC transport system substrate-binding protein